MTNNNSKTTNEVSARSWLKSFGVKAALGTLLAVTPLAFFSVASVDGAPQVVAGTSSPDEIDVG